MKMTAPGYVALHESGELARRAARAVDALAACSLCPRACGADRRQGALGFCRTGRKACVASAHSHFGEEPPLVGRRGSGTIFFGSCNLRCSFCQNFEISDGQVGSELAADELAEVMVELAREGCHNINLVTPSHVVPQILEALPFAVERGLRVPLVYNTSAYDTVETLRLLEGVVDIYLPDFKFWEPEWPRRYCQAPDYPAVARAALREMHRQVGDLVLDDEGVAVRGLLVRHLAMPGGVAGTDAVMEFLARELSPDTCVNVMDQYRPCGASGDDDVIHRPITRDEYRAAVAAARRAGLHRLA